MYGITRAHGYGIARLFAAALVAITMACGGDSTGPSSSGNDNQPTGNNSPSTAITMTNQANHSAWYVYFKSCGTAEWGADRLGADILSVGETQSWPVAAGCYDVKANTSSDHNGEFIWEGVQVPDGQATQLTITEWHDAS